LKVGSPRWNDELKYAFYYFIRYCTRYCTVVLKEGSSGIRLK
jgi:hypothetical protein